MTPAWKATLTLSAFCFWIALVFAVPEGFARTAVCAAPLLGGIWLALYLAFEAWK